MDGEVGAERIGGVRVEGRVFGEQDVARRVVQGALSGR